MMGRRKNGNGEGSKTPEKERFFALCLGDHVTREARYLLSLAAPRPFFHIDLNAGPGFNQGARCAGTPVAFMKQAAKFPRLPIDATFVEKNPLFIERLRERMGARFPGAFNGNLFAFDRNFRIIQGDNEHHLARFVREVVPRLDKPALARGSIISDPNGWARSGGSVSLELLTEAASTLPRFLLLIFFPYALAKMGEGYGQKGERGATTSITTRNIKDFLPLRRHWLVARHGSYAYLCGSAIRMRQGTEFVPAFSHDSREGRAIIERCSTIQDRSRSEARRLAMESA